MKERGGPATEKKCEVEGGGDEGANAGSSVKNNTASNPLEYRKCFEKEDHILRKSWNEKGGLTVVSKTVRYQKETKVHGKKKKKKRKKKQTRKTRIKNWYGRKSFANPNLVKEKKRCQGLGWGKKTAKIKIRKRIEKRKRKNFGTKMAVPSKRSLHKGKRKNRKCKSTDLCAQSDVLEEQKKGWDEKKKRAGRGRRGGGAKRTAERWRRKGGWGGRL